MKHKQSQTNSNIINGHILRVGTLFSGIGAFEEALKQLKIPHEIKFACDNGEIELIPIDDKKDRKAYIDLNRHIRKLDSTEKERLNHYKEIIAQRIEEIRQYCYNLPTKEERTQYVNNLYRQYEGDRKNHVRESYLANYNISPNDFHTDIRFMRGNEYYGHVDILVGGSPCQSFSTYGKKQGLEDARGTLFYDYARIIKETSPKVFIYENVAAIKTNDDGHTWETMLSVWKSIGYKIFPKILNAVDYNHPQLRRRMFIVGIREDICTTPYEFPKKKSLRKKSADFLENGPIPLKYYLGKGGFTWITTYEKHKRRSRVNQDIIGCQTANQQDNWIGDFRIEHPLPEHYADERIYIGQYDFKDGKGLVDAVGRKLTPRECLRLMGFSDNFRIVVDDHQTYHQSGNSIVVPVLKEIIKTLIPYLKENA
ncbi:MAG: DNA (cytosine-5-)-methyltransferase [Salinivirgaceae bacterium]|nr:DNA (cytosine-5-)-methyltransferase [Salinivirgaceae bacterium]